MTDDLVVELAWQALGMIDLDSARYVALTTFKKDGTPVATPVWITGSNGAYAFTTGETPGRANV